MPSFPNLLQISQIVCNFMNVESLNEYTVLKILYFKMSLLVEYFPYIKRAISYYPLSYFCIIPFSRKSKVKTKINRKYLLYSLLKVSSFTIFGIKLTSPPWNHFSSFSCLLGSLD